MSHRRLITAQHRRLLAAVVLGTLAAPQCAAAAVSSPPLPAESAEVKQLLDEAQKAIQSGNVALALIQLKNAVRIAPTDGIARVQLGIALIRIGELEAADRELRSARKDGAPSRLVLPPLIQVMFLRNEYQLMLTQFPDPGATSNDPTAADILAARALALQHLNRGAEANDAMNRSLELRRDAQGLLNRARLSVQQGDRQGAIRFLDQATRDFPDNAEAWILKTDLLSASSGKDAALALADQLGSRFPGNISAQLERIEILVRLGQDAKAGLEVEKMLAQHPRLPMAVYYKALLMARKGDVKEAWQLGQTLPPESLEENPDMALAVAQMAENAGRLDSAGTILSRTLAKHPDIPSVRIRLAALRLEQDSPTSALGILDPIKNSSDPKVIALLSRARNESDRNNVGVTAIPAPPQPAQALSVPSDQQIRVLAAAVSKEPTNAAQVLPFIRALVQKRRFSEALAAANGLARDPKQRAMALAYRGDILLVQHDLRGAQAAFDRAVQIEPHNKTVLQTRAGALLAAQKNTEAGRDFQTILSLDPKDMTALLGLAEVAARQGRDGDVRQILNKAIALWPQSEPPRMALISYLQAKGDLKPALESANDLIRLHPTSADGIARQGQIQLALGNKKEAVASFRRLASLFPAAAGPQVQLAVALYAAQDRAGATRAMDEAVKLDPNSVKVRAQQVGLLLTLDKANQAVAAARSYQELRPGVEADFLLANTLVTAGQAHEAANLLSKRFSDKPDGAVLQKLMQISTQSDDNRRTQDLASKWLSRHPDDLGVRMVYASLLLRMRDNGGAIAQYETLLKKDPRNSAAMNNLALLIQSSDPKRAVSLLTAAMNLSPQMADPPDSLGWIKLEQKDTAGGLKLLQQAHALRPQDGEITYHLIVALDAGSDRNSARKLLKALLASGTQFADRPAATKLSSVWQ